MSGRPLRKSLREAHNGMLLSAMSTLIKVTPPWREVTSKVRVLIRQSTQDPF